MGNVFHSNLNSKTSGTAILIHKRIQFSVTTVTSDPQGRFVTVSGLLYHKPVYVINIYAPNWDDDKFMGKIISLIPDLNSHRLIFVGDLNCVINPVLDRSNPKSTNLTIKAKLVSAFMDQIGSVYPWRGFFPQSKSFSVFTSVHHSNSRIDYFLLTIIFSPLSQTLNTQL